MPPMPPYPLPPVTAPPGAFPPPPMPPGPAPALPITSEHKTANDACIKRLQDLNVLPAPKLYPLPKDPGTAGYPLDILTNVFGIEVHKSVELFQYNISIKADLTPTKEVVFTKKAKEDFVVTDRHEKCCAVLFHAIERNQDFFHAPDNSLIYDGQNMLYSTFNLFGDLPMGSTKTKVIQVNGAEMGHQDLDRLPLIKLEVYTTKNPSVRFSQDDLGRRTSDTNIESINRAYHNILELALNQFCIRDFSRCVVFEHGKVFFLKPLEEGYERRDCIEVGDGKMMYPGIKKTVQFIEGPYGRGSNNPSIVIDSMKVAFHKDQTVMEKINDINLKPCGDGLSDFERDKCQAVIKGLDCYTTYTGRVRHLKIEGIHHDNALKARFQLKTGGTSTVHEYFQQRWQIRLQHPQANLISCIERGKQNFYPMEVIRISPKQRVKITQQTGKQSQITTKAGAVPPADRQRLIMTGKNAAKINQENKILSDLGLQVYDDPLLVPARQLPRVRIAEHKTGPEFPERGNKWRFNHFARPATPPEKWAIYAVGLQNSKFDKGNLAAITDRFLHACKFKGLNMPEQIDQDLVNGNNIEERLAMAAKGGCKYVLVITDDSIVNLHQKYKVIESLRGMIVQDLRMSVALDICSNSRNETIENIVQKTNVKLGGSNYIFSDMKNLLNGVLCIGIGISNPPPNTKFAYEGRGLLNPMVLGFAYNGMAEQEFYGDFVLSPAGQDTIAPIEDIINQCILGYKKWHDGNPPKAIIVYRSGVSEGNHGNIISYEIPLARTAISKSTKLIYIAVSKDHTFRFFKNEDVTSSASASKSQSQTSVGSRSSTSSRGPKVSEQNIAPGLVVDSVVTNPACKQFFLNSHITLQGSAKTPLYTVLADDSYASMDRLEELTYSLCHLHQIVGLPTSLPTPLYVANEYAKRGRNLWNEANVKDPAIRDADSERTRLQQLTDSINYKSAGDLVDRRVNA
ncbi:hypothetical protein GCK72_000356 [Caenorhabditis remanei]|uniref:Piwi domain-containing protein n=1 Tax=Caenorhabditis remanei TaxID=31234 RepID=A0A6A5HPL8_CAERE|nr:hypothetical protein GCK72_000356 [Caenorhabditis remanei]KAF1768544.1 hypothetical protein GCK72_000356 [Caenorhabditis remanei]